jgi:hypothetical protein
MHKSIVIASFLMMIPMVCLAKGHTIHFSKGVNHKVVGEWAHSLDKISTIGSSTYIRKKVGGKDKLHRKGHRDVIVWVPDTTDLTKDFIVVLWFHGHYGYVPKRTFQNRTLKQFVPLAKTKNFVVVIPEMPWSVHTSTPTKRNSRLWLKKGSFMKFVSQVEDILVRHANIKESDVTRTEIRLGKIDYRIVGHSAGGSTIKRLGITGDLCRLNPSVVVWSDSSYGSWLDLAWKGCLKEHGILTKVFVQKWGAPYRSTMRFINELGKVPKKIELNIMLRPWVHKTIGDNVVKLSGLLEDVHEVD